MKKIFLTIILCLTFSFISINFSLAAEKKNSCGDETTKGYQCTANTAGKTCVSNKCLAEADNVKCCKDGEGGSNAALPNPLGTTDINLVAARIINNVLGLVGTISLILFIYGGLIWMTSAGSADKVKKGRDILVWAVIGMAVVFLSYMMVKFVIQGVQGTF
jgi:hypothetical protein